MQSSRVCDYRVQNFCTISHVTSVTSSSITHLQLQQLAPPTMEEEARQQATENCTALLCTPLLDHDFEEPLQQADDSICVDWLGRPADARRPNLGGWNCSLCIIGAAMLNCLSFYGITYNLVLYMVRVFRQSNAAAASAMTTFSGTALICSFIGAFLGDAYLGRLWTAVTFQGLLTLILAMVSIIVTVISTSSPTALESSLFFVMLYMMAVSSGPFLPNALALGADQLKSAEEKQRYFQVSSVISSIGQLVSATAVTAVFNAGMWSWGFWLCTAASAASSALLALPISRMRQFKAGGNPFLRNVQVLVAACRKHSVSLPHDASLLHECPGKLSPIPGCCKLQHTDTLSFLDKAAVVVDSSKAATAGPWRLCTVTQVEELKTVLRAIPAGIAVIVTVTAFIQSGSLFEEQANEMNRHVTSWLAIPPASINLFTTVGSILTGIVISTVSMATLCGCWWWGSKSPRAVSLQLQAGAIVVDIIAMGIAAAVEVYRRSEAEKGYVISVVWLVPQAVILGAGQNLVIVGGSDFFYNEMSDGMRTVGISLLYIFLGAGSYGSSILVALVTALSTRGGRPGWIASNLNDGHLDYFYGLLALCLAFALAISLLYIRSFLGQQKRHGDERP